MVDHGVHISGCYKKTKAGFAKYLNALFLSPVRLWNDAYTVASAFQKTADNGRTKRRMVYIGISGKINKIYLIPSSFNHFFFCYR